MQELSDLDKWLLSSIVHGGVAEGVISALKAGANVDVLHENGTPLHLAVKNEKDLSIVKALIDGGASVNLTDRDFNTAIEITAQNGSYDVLYLLLESRKPFESSRGKFEQYVQYCVDHYIARDGQDFEAQNHALIAHYASRLAGKNVGNLLAQDFNDEKYVVHLYGFRKAARGNIPLEGWQPEVFLPLRIFSFFEILVKLKRGIIKPVSVNSEVLAVSVRNIEDEILMACEVLRTVRDRLAIKKINDIITEAEENCLGERDYSQNDVMDEDDELEEGQEEDSLSVKIDRLYVCLAQAILNRVAILKNGESYAVSIGFTDHEIYLTFFRFEEHILIRIDNLGYGTEKHAKDPNNASNIFPYQLCSLLAASVENDQTIRDYLAGVLRIRNCQKTMQGPGEHEELNEIYSQVLTGTHKSYAGEWPQMSARELQQAGNCVLESQQLGLFLRAYDRSFFDWLLNQERQCVVNQDRKKYAPHASEDKYWREELLGDVNLDERAYGFVFDHFSINETMKDLFDVWAVCLTNDMQIMEKFRNTLSQRQNAHDEFRRLLHDNNGPTLMPGMFDILMVYRTGNFSQLGGLASSISNNFGENPTQEAMIRFFLYWLPHLLFHNQSESIDEYNKLENLFNEMKGHRCMTAFFLFINGLVDLKRALHYHSTFIFYKARESLSLSLQDSENPLLGFFTYYFLGICEYNLGKFQESYDSFARALSKIKLAENDSNGIQAKKQQCLYALGYLCLELKKDISDAERNFEEAKNIKFVVERDTNFARVQTFEGNLSRVKETVEVTSCPNDVVLGLGICCQLRSLSSRLPQEQERFYLEARKNFNSCLLKEKNQKLRSFAEKKLLEIEEKMKGMELSALAEATQGEKKRGRVEAPTQSAFFAASSLGK